MAKKQLPIRAVLKKINLAHHISLHLFGKHHTHIHRISIGIVIGFVGLYIEGLFHHYPLLIEWSAKFSGMSLHAIGIVPIIDRLAEHAEP